MKITLYIKARPGCLTCICKVLVFIQVFDRKRLWHQRLRSLTAVVTATLPAHLSHKISWQSNDPLQALVRFVRRTTWPIKVKSKDQTEGNRTGLQLEL